MESRERKVSVQLDSGVKRGTKTGWENEEKAGKESGVQSEVDTAVELARFCKGFFQAP